MKTMSVPWVKHPHNTPGWNMSGNGLSRTLKGLSEVLRPVKRRSWRKNGPHPWFLCAVYHSSRWIWEEFRWLWEDSMGSGVSVLRRVSSRFSAASRSNAVSGTNRRTNRTKIPEKIETHPNVHWYDLESDRPIGAIHSFSDYTSNNGCQECSTKQWHSLNSNTRTTLMNKIPR